MPEDTARPVDFATLAVEVVPFTKSNAVVWRDGKPRCARHPDTCLVRAVAIGLRCGGHLCARCMREACDA